VQLEQAIRDSWSRDTADPDNEWSPRNPSCGQCDITSLVVHDLLGGRLLGADVFLDGERVEAHMWNRVGTGIEVDLTREQFKRGGGRRQAGRPPATGDLGSRASALPPVREVPRALAACPGTSRSSGPGRTSVRSWQVQPHPNTAVEAERHRLPMPLLL